MVQAELKRPLHIALSYDEEIGCLGAPVMIAELQKRGLTPEHRIVGEPTSMRMVVAHKGIHTFRCAVHGKAAHSSLTPQGVNAIEYAAKLIVFINELAGRLKARHDTDPDYDVPFSTLSVNTIAGGIAGNIVPQLCEFEFDYRNLPHEPRRRSPRRSKPTSAKRCSRKRRRWYARLPHRHAPRRKRARHARSRSGFAARFDYAIGGRLKPSESGLCHRRRSIPAGRHRHRDLRPRQYRAGAQSR